MSWDKADRLNGENLYLETLLDRAEAAEELALKDLEILLLRRRIRELERELAAARRARKVRVRLGDEAQRSQS